MLHVIQEWLHPVLWDQTVFPVYSGVPKGPMRRFVVFFAREKKGKKNYEKNAPLLLKYAKGALLLNFSKVTFIVIYTGN